MLYYGVGWEMLYYWSRMGACSPNTGVGGEMLYYGVGGEMLYYLSRRRASPLLPHGIGGEHAPLLLHGVGWEHAPLILE